MSDDDVTTPPSNDRESSPDPVAPVPPLPETPEPDGSPSETTGRSPRSAAMRRWLGRHRVLIGVAVIVVAALACMPAWLPSSPAPPPGVTRTFPTGNGTTGWAYTANDKYWEALNGVVADGHVFVTDGGGLIALDEATGRVEWLWSGNVGTSMQNASPDIQVSAPYVYVNSEGRSLVALDAATGATRWTAPWFTERWRAGDGMVFVSTGDSIVALDGSTGVPRWWQPTPASQPTPAGQPTPISTDAIPVALAHSATGQDLLLEVTDQLLYAVDTATGRIAWETAVPGRAITTQTNWPIAAVSGDVVLVADQEGYVNPYGGAPQNVAQLAVTSYSLSTGAVLRTRPITTDATHLKPIPDGRVLATADGTSGSLIDPNTLDAVQIVPPDLVYGVPDPVIAGQFLYGYDVVSRGDQDTVTTVVAVNIPTGQPQWTYHLPTSSPYGGGVNVIGADHDTTFVASGNTLFTVSGAGVGPPLTDLPSYAAPTVTLTVR